MSQFSDEQEVERELGVAGFIPRALCRFESGEGGLRGAWASRGRRAPDPGRSGSERVRPPRPGLGGPRALGPGRGPAPGAQETPGPSAAASAPGNRRTRQGPAGLLPKGQQPPVLLLLFFFFFFTPSGGRAGLGTGRRRVPPRRPRGAGPGRTRGPGRRGPGPPAQPRSGRSPWQRARGGEGPGGAGRGGCYFCRFLFLAATSPWQPCYSARRLPGWAGARDPGRPRPRVSRSPRPPPPAPPRAPRPRPALPLAVRPVPAAGREIDGGRLLKNIVTVSVFITLTRERYLLLLFADRAAGAPVAGARGCRLCAGPGRSRLGGEAGSAGTGGRGEGSLLGLGSRCSPGRPRRGGRRPEARVEGGRLQHGEEQTTPLSGRRCPARTRFLGAGAEQPRSLWRHLNRHQIKTRTFWARPDHARAGSPGCAGKGSNSSPAEAWLPANPPTETPEPRVGHCPRPHSRCRPAPTPGEEPAAQRLHEEPGQRGGSAAGRCRGE